MTRDYITILEQNDPYMLSKASKVYTKPHAEMCFFQGCKGYLQGMPIAFGQHARYPRGNGVYSR